MTPTPSSTRRTGRGEPVLLLHPFLLSRHAWDEVMESLADGYDLLAVTMLDHWGGARRMKRALSIAALADDVETRLDEIGWDTCHIVGNSLGGWVAVELERRGRARSLTLIAPAGGWHDHSLSGNLIGAKFLALAPILWAGRLFGDRFAQARLAQRAGLMIVSRRGAAVRRHTAANFLRAATHCAALLPMLWAGVRDGGIHDLDAVRVPTTLMLAGKDRLLPNPRYSRRYVAELPGTTTTLTLIGIGHVPMYENPAVVSSELRAALARHRAQAADTTARPLPA